MSDLFVPPPNARIFRMLRSATGGPPAYPMVWVYPALPIGTNNARSMPAGCACTEYYPVILDSLPHWAIVALEGCAPVVCNCRGRLL